MDIFQKQIEKLKWNDWTAFEEIENDRQYIYSSFKVNTFNKSLLIVITIFCKKEYKSQSIRIEKEIYTLEHVEKIIKRYKKFIGLLNEPKIL